MRTKLGKKLGWEAGTGRAEDPQGTSGWGPGFRKKQRELRTPGETPGQPQGGEGMSCQTKGRTENQRRDEEGSGRSGVSIWFSKHSVCSLRQVQCRVLRKQTVRYRGCHTVAGSLAQKTSQQTTQGLVMHERRKVLRKCPRSMRSEDAESRVRGRGGAGSETEHDGTPDKRVWRMEHTGQGSE